MKVVGDFVENYRQDLPSELGLLSLFDPRTGAPDRGPRRERHHRHAHRRGDRVGAKLPGQAGCQDARPHRRARDRLLERAAARLAVRLRDDPRAFAPPRQPRGFRRGGSLATSARRSSRRDDWRSCVEGADIVVEASRLHRAAAAAADRVDQAGRAGDPVRDDERRGALPYRHHVEDRGRRLGPVRDREVRGAARARRGGQADAGECCTRSSARSSPGCGPAARTTTETILFWHRGLSLSDIALGQAMLAKAAAMGVGQQAAVRMSEPSYALGSRG